MTDVLPARARVALRATAMTGEAGVSEVSAGGCLKVLAIAIPILALAAFLIWKVSQASGRASEVSERVVGPYLELIRAGEYQKALDDHGSDAFRKRVSATELKGAYDALSKQYGRFQSYELYLAQEQHEIGGPSIVQAKYKLVFEKAQENVVYDIAGEGDAARIDVSYTRVTGGTLRPAPR
jgi:hypothetical protein